MPSQPPRTARLSSTVHDSLYGIRSQLSNFQFTSGLLRCCLLSMLVLVAVGIVDFFWPLPTFVRAFAWIGVLGCAAVFLVRWIKHNGDIDELDAAKEMEATHPELGQRLRTAYQFEAEEGTSQTPELTAALINETNQRVERVDFSDTVVWWRLLPRTAMLVAVGFAIVCMLVFVRESRTTFARLLMIPTHYTDISVDAMVPIVAGSDARFEATISGRPLNKVELWTRSGNAEWSRQPMRSVADEDAGDTAKLVGALATTVEQCERDFEYKVVGYPVSSRSFTLKVLQPLTQQKFTAAVEPPAYTGIGSETHAEMDLTVVEGSLVSWEIELSREPSQAKLISATKSPLQQLTIDGNKIVGDVSQLEESIQYEVQATAEDGMKFVSERIHIRVKKDKGPTVAFRKPQEQLEVTPTTEVGLQLNVEDDFGLSKVGIEYQINGGEKQTLWEQDLTDAKETSLTTMPVVYLENHGLAHDDAITYYAYAEDNREQPKRTRSELRFIDIRPYKREYQIVDGQCQGSGGSCLSLEELIARQRHNLRRTFANLDRQPIQDALGKRLATSQTEILEATRDFTSGWERKFGPMPSLHAATSAMKDAAEELRQKQLDPAMPLEETALANLVKARQNARKFLKNCSSGQFGQCKKYDNEMVQKLRAPKQDESQPNEQSLAETREDIQDLAEQQRRFSEEIARGSGGPQLDKQPQPNSSSSSGKSSAQSQQQAGKQAEQLQQQLRQNEITTELAQQRMNEIAEQIKASAVNMAAHDPTTAAKQALEAAERLEDLAEHLKALGSPDLSERLALAEQLASQLASAEDEIASELEGNMDIPTAARTQMAAVQRKLGESTETLADLVHHLEADALGEHRELREGLGELQDLHQPEQLASNMQRVANDIKDGSTRAATGARAAASELGKIAMELTQLRRGIMQPQLDQLLAAEARAADLLQAIHDGRQQAELMAQYDELQRQLAALHISAQRKSSTNDSNQASPASGQGSSTNRASNAAASGSSDGDVSEPQFFYAGRNVNSDLRIVMDILQTKIQDAILLTARMDADEPIPAKYRKLVDEYYQALSDDLR